jgi:thymidylate kinase
LILALEGLDGSGKTTVGRVVAQSLGANFVTGVPASLGIPSDTFFANFDRDSRYLFYLAAAAVIAEEYSQDPHLAVVDRFVAGAHALHVGVPGAVGLHLQSLTLPPPDLSIYLEVHEEERTRRLRCRKRNLDPFELKLSVDSCFRNRVADAMKQYPNTVVLDTTKLDVDEVSAQAAEIWRAHFPGGSHVRA